MLAWDPSSWATGYLVSYGTQSGVYTNSIDVGNQTRFQINGLTAGTTYYFAVKAYNPAGMSGASTEVNGVASAVANPFGLPDSPDEGSVTGVDTPAGSDVFVLPVRDFVVKFTKVTSPGRTAVSVVSSAQASNLAAAIRYGDWIYRVTTTAQFSGPVTIGAAYGTFASQAQGAIRLYGRTDVSAFTDSSRQVIWGSNANLSDSFYLTEAKPLITSLTYGPTAATAGTTMTFVAAADGSGTPVNYQFWRYDPGLGYHMVQDYSSDNSYSWTSTRNDAGSHSIQAWVKRPDSPAPYDVYRGATFTLGATKPLSVTRLAPNTTVLSAGRSITWTATTAGGIGPIQYQFWRYDGSGWSMVRDYSTSASYSWSTTTDDVGPHSLQVWARSADSTARYDGWLGTAFTIVPPAPLKATSIVVTPTLPAPAGSTVTFTPTTVGGTEPLEYQFWRYDQGSGWQMVQDYGSNASYGWATGGGDVGTHAVQAWVRTVGSTSSYEAFATSGYFMVTSPPAPRILSFASNVRLPVQAGSWITWTATAVSTGGALEYEFWRYKASTGWSVVQPYSSDNSYTWPTASNEAGTYSLQVWVRRVGQTANYEAWAGTSFTIAP